MFQRLKECKTLKEIYEVLGTEWFEKVAAVLLGLWMLMPLMAAANQIFWGLTEENQSIQVMCTMMDYQTIMSVLGVVTLELAVVYLLGRLLLMRGKLIEQVKAKPWHFLLLLMLLWACIATALSDNPGVSFRGTDYRYDGLQSYFFYAAVYVCAVLVVKGRYRKKLFLLYTIAANVTSLILILQDRGVEFINRCFLATRAAMFFQFNHTGYYLNMGIVCLMGLYLYEESHKWRAYYVASMAFQIYAILVNSTLGSFLGTCGALVMILIFFVRKQGRLSWRMLTPVLVVVLLSIASYVGLIPTSSGQDMKVNIATLTQDIKNILQKTQEAKEAGHGRVSLWREGLKMIPERPIFGYGPEQLNAEYAKNMWVDRPDNEFIQHAIFLGVPGLVYYLEALILLFVHQWKHMKELEESALIAAGCVIAYLISSCFGNTMFYTTPYLYLFLGFATLSVKKKEKI